MISPEEAKKLAVEFAKEKDYPNISLANVRVSDGEEYWIVWIGKTINILPAEYVFKVNKETGEVIHWPQK